jgi:ABC-2 type transport system permease protein
VYRWNFLLRVVFGFVPLIGTFFLWGAFFGDASQKISGYAFQNMISSFAYLNFFIGLSAAYPTGQSIVGTRG